MILAFFVSALYIGSGHANSCPTLLKDSTTWNALYTSFKLYRQCDDGVIGESYSESVARVLVDHWNTLPELAHLSRKDTEFRGFVLKHIDATLDPGDVAKIRKKASAQCPAGLKKLCGDVEKQAKLALKELH
jgi:hypothetical protein